MEVWIFPDVSSWLWDERIWDLTEVSFIYFF